MDLLIFFAIPLAVIILSAVLERVIHCPTAVAGVTFAILLIVTFAVYDVSFLIETIIYTIISYITALFVKFICCVLDEDSEECRTGCGCRNNMRNPLTNLAANTTSNLGTKSTIPTLGTLNTVSSTPAVNNLNIESTLNDFDTSSNLNNFSNLNDLNNLNGRNSCNCGFKRR